MPILQILITVDIDKDTLAVETNIVEQQHVVTVLKLATEFAEKHWNETTVLDKGENRW